MAFTKPCCTEPHLRRLAVGRTGDGGLNVEVEECLDAVLSRRIRVTKLSRIWGSED